jgi:hypothetical protein
VKRDSLQDLYSVKSDDELLNLAADEVSLREEAKPLLAAELRRRNLDVSGVSATKPCEAEPELGTVNSTLSRAKWVGLWLLASLIATYGALINVGIIIYTLRPLISHTARIHFAQKYVYSSYHPLPILIALLIGFFSYTRFRGTYRYWVWVLPMFGLLSSLLDWKQSNEASLADSLRHFFGPLTYPANRDQLDSVLLYMSLAYVLGVLVHTIVQTTLRIRLPGPVGCSRQSAV